MAGEQNGWLSNYVVEAKSEIEKLDGEITGIKDEIKGLKVSPEAESNSTDRPVGGNRQ